jgi:uracil-DNA glycosylase
VTGCHLFRGGVRGEKKMDEYSFGYPTECKRCAPLSDARLPLRVCPYFRKGDEVRVMLIGQDPTISRKPERVKHVLMLDQPNRSLSRWLREEVFGKKYFDSMTLYATNLVKCSFRELPSRLGGLKFLGPYFENCKYHLAQEISRFQPTLLLTLGEPAHNSFISTLDNRDSVADRMKEAFTGKFVKAKFRGIEFDYSPCLHIQTFRVAHTYGDRLKGFKRGLAAYFKGRANSSAAG